MCIILIDETGRMILSRSEIYIMIVITLSWTTDGSLHRVGGQGKGVKDERKRADWIGGTECGVSMGGNSESGRGESMRIESSFVHRATEMHAGHGTTEGRAYMRGVSPDPRNGKID